MYADDTKCFSTINCLEDVDAFQHNIEKLMLWSCDWQLCFNASKCKVGRILRGLANWLLLKEFLTWLKLTTNVTWG